MIHRSLLSGVNGGGQRRNGEEERNIFALCNALYYYLTEKCGHPLGLESKQISDSQLTASSSWMSTKKYGPQQARLNNRVWPQGWIADSKDKDPWLKIKLNGRHIITGIATQGYGNQLFNEWVKSYIMSWYDPKHRGYVNYHEEGNDKVNTMYMT